MATDLRSVEYSKGTLTYDPDMRMGDLRKLFSAANSGDLEEMMQAYSGIIVTWPHEGEPSDLEAWDGLRRSEFMALNEAMMKDLAEQGEA